MNTALAFPHEERAAGRPTSRPRPLYEELGKFILMTHLNLNLIAPVTAGAHMGFSAGWEVPLWYAAPGSSPSYQPSFFRTNWQEEQAREYEGLTRRVALADLSSFGKFVLTGRDARRLLDVATANTVPRPGRTVLCHMLTQAGTVKILSISCVNTSGYPRSMRS